MNSLFASLTDSPEDSGGTPRRRLVAIGATVLVAASAGIIGFVMFTHREDRARTPDVLPASLPAAPVETGGPIIGGAQAPVVDPVGSLPDALPPLVAGETHYGKGESLYRLGVALRQAGQFEEAIPALQNAARLDPGSARALVNLGRAFNDAGRHEEALTAAEEAARLDPQSAGAWNVRGRALLNLGRRDEAIGAFESALGIDPGDAWVLNNLGYALIGAGRVAEAVPPLEKAIGMRSGVGVFHNNLGMAYERTGRYAEALGEYRRAVEGGAGEAAERNERRLAEAVELVGPGAEKTGLLDE